MVLHFILKSGHLSLMTNKLIPNALCIFLEKIECTIDDIHDLVIDFESKKYAACTFTLHNKKILFRSAKKTPKKVGMFVTAWKRVSVNHDICPFDETDPIDYVIVESKDDVHDGYFLFAKNVLIEQGIFSTKKKDGKRAFRLYSPFHNLQNKQSLKTQNWQRKFFSNHPKFEGLFI